MAQADIATFDINSIEASKYNWDGKDTSHNIKLKRYIKKNNYYFLDEVSFGALDDKKYTVQKGSTPAPGYPQEFTLLSGEGGANIAKGEHVVIQKDEKLILENTLTVDEGGRLTNLGEIVVINAKGDLIVNGIFSDINIRNCIITLEDLVSRMGVTKDVTYKMEKGSIVGTFQEYTLVNGTGKSFNIGRGEHVVIQKNERLILKNELTVDIGGVLTNLGDICVDVAGGLVVNGTFDEKINSNVMITLSNMVEGSVLKDDTYEMTKGATPTYGNPRIFVLLADSSPTKKALNIASDEHIIIQKNEKLIIQNEMTIEEGATITNFGEIEVDIAGDFDVEGILKYVCYEDEDYNVPFGPTCVEDFIITAKDFYEIFYNAENIGIPIYNKRFKVPKGITFKNNERVWTRKTTDMTNKEIKSMLSLVTWKKADGSYFYLEKFVIDRWVLDISNNQTATTTITNTVTTTTETDTSITSSAVVKTTTPINKVKYTNVCLRSQLITNSFLYNLNTCKGTSLCWGDLLIALDNNEGNGAKRQLESNPYKALKAGDEVTIVFMLRNPNPFTDNIFIRLPFVIKTGGCCD